MLFHFTIEQLERARIRAVLDKYVSKNVRVSGREQRLFGRLSAAKQGV